MSRVASFPNLWTETVPTAIVKFVDTSVSGNAVPGSEAPPTANDVLASSRKIRVSRKHFIELDPLARLTLVPSFRKGTDEFFEFIKALEYAGLLLCCRMAVKMPNVHISHYVNPSQKIFSKAA